MRMVLEDGVSHAVDSNELSFRMAAIGAVRASTSPCVVVAITKLAFALLVLHVFVAQCVYCFVHMTIRFP